MVENTFKIPREGHSKSIFRRVEEWMKLDKVFVDGLPVKYAPHVLFITMLGVIYVGNTHFAESTQRKINRIQVETEDMRADYTTLKAEYMFARLQSVVAKKLKDNGIVESETPPVKIIVQLE
jgi:hypothetical protein